MDKISGLKTTIEINNESTQIKFVPTQMMRGCVFLRRQGGTNLRSLLPANISSSDADIRIQDKHLWVSTTLRRS